MTGSSISSWVMGQRRPSSGARGLVAGGAVGAGLPVGLELGAAVGLLLVGEAVGLDEGESVGAGAPAAIYVCVCGSVIGSDP